MARLTPKQARFCEEYLVDLNATQAAIRAGYAAKSANANAARMMANDGIQARIAALQVERSERVSAKADDVLRELARIAFGDIRQVVQWGPDGVELKPSGTLSSDAAMLVEEVSEGPDGRIKVKTKPAIRALELLGKHLGVFVDRLRVEGAQTFDELIDGQDRWMRENGKTEAEIEAFWRDEE